MEINGLSNSQMTMATTQTSETDESQGPRGGQRPSHEEAVSDLGASLTEDQQSEILSGIEAMQEEGATDEEIKEYVDSALEDYGVDLSSQAAATGTLTDTVA